MSRLLWRLPSRLLAVCLLRFAAGDAVCRRFPSKLTESSLQFDRTGGHYDDSVRTEFPLEKSEEYRLCSPK